MKFNYYLHVFEGKDVLYRINKEGRIGESVETLQVFFEGKWFDNLRARKSFMNHYVTGWIDEGDVIENYDKAKKELIIRKYSAIKDFAITSHKNQLYGKYPYEIHLVNVVSVLFRNGIVISEENYPLLASAWLHDILEDTAITKDEFIDRFGQQVFDIVWALTDGEGKNRKEKKDVMYEKLVHNQKAIIVKLADRIANIEFSLINQNLDHLDKYVFENKELNSRLKNNIRTDLGNSLLKYLNSLVFNI